MFLHQRKPLPIWAQLNRVLYSIVIQFFFPKHFLYKRVSQSVCVHINVNAFIWFISGPGKHNFPSLFWQRSHAFFVSAAKAYIFYEHIPARWWTYTRKLQFIYVVSMLALIVNMIRFDNATALCLNMKLYNVCQLH